MRLIDLPVADTVSLNLRDGVPKKETIHVDENGAEWVYLGEMYNSEIRNSINTARENGGKILYATTSLEKKIELILSDYFMGSFSGYSVRRQIFEVEVMQAPALSFKAKKDLITSVLNAEKPFDGKKRNRLSRNLKKVMDWRNAFAHGTVQHDTEKKVFLEFYSGALRKEWLNDEFWDEVETIFAETDDLLKRLHGAI